MTDEHAPATLDPSKGDGPKNIRPRIALMGEFSAGKSTLANLLLERDFSPVQVTATQLPPVWLSYGPSKAHHVDRNGAVKEVPMETWSSAVSKETPLVMIEHDADILEAADLIDMPGTSDPNLSVDYWEQILPVVDIVVWCTPSNQAWRQSEAALWSQVPAELQQRSILLVTRMDQIRADIDKARILHRVENEAGSSFRAVLPVSLTQALAAADDDAELEQSGAADLVRMLIDCLAQVEGLKRYPFDPKAFVSNLHSDAPKEVTSPPLRAAPTRTVVPRRIVRKGPPPERPPRPAQTAPDPRGP